MYEVHQCGFFRGSTLLPFVFANESWVTLCNLYNILLNRHLCAPPFSWSGLNPFRVKFFVFLL